MDKYYYYTTRQYHPDGWTHGWRVCKNTHPLTPLNLNKIHVTFWEEITEDLAKELIRMYKNDKWNLNQDGSINEPDS